MPVQDRWRILDALGRGENPLELTRRIKAKVRELQAVLPAGVRILPFYDRTPLIEGAVGTVTTTVVEGMVSASLCVLLILLHMRTSLVIAVMLPLSALSDAASISRASSPFWVTPSRLR